MKIIDESLIEKYATVSELIENEIPFAVLQEMKHNKSEYYINGMTRDAAATAYRKYRGEFNPHIMKFVGAIKELDLQKQNIAYAKAAYMSICEALEEKHRHSAQNKDGIKDGTEITIAEHKNQLNEKSSLEL